MQTFAQFHNIHSLTYQYILRPICDAQVSSENKPFTFQNAFSFTATASPSLTGDCSINPTGGSHPSQAHTPILAMHPRVPGYVFVRSLSLVRHNCFVMVPDICICICMQAYQLLSSCTRCRCGITISIISFTARNMAERPFVCLSVCRSVCKQVSK